MKKKTRKKNQKTIKNIKTAIVKTTATAIMTI